MLELGLFWIGIVLVSAALIMLFLDSFQSRRMWALVSLVLVFPLFIHMVFNWSTLNVRKALYVFIIGLLAVLVSVSGGVLSQLSFLQDHEVVQVLEEKIALPEDTPLSNQQQADKAALGVEENYDPLLTGSEYEQLEAKEIVPENINQVIRKNEPRARYELVTDDDRMHALNKHVRVTMKDASVIEGMLTEIVDDSIIVESLVNGGSLGLSYKNDQIQSVAVRLMEGEKLYVQEEKLELEQKQEADKQLNVDQLGTVLEKTEVLQEKGTQPTQEILEIDAGSTQVYEIEKQSTLETLEESTMETEVLEKVEEIVDDTKLLDNLGSQ